MIALVDGPIRMRHEDLSEDTQAALREMFGPDETKD
jgi:hypothetical protein